MTDRPIAVCPACEAPLVCTMHWAKHEFYCLDCGRHYGWLEPARGEPTVELTERMAAYEAEWEAHERALITPRAWRSECPKCRLGGEYHDAHATPAELHAHDLAHAWIKSRLRIPA